MGIVQRMKEDLYWEHDQHFTYEELCSECYIKTHADSWKSGKKNQINDEKDGEGPVGNRICE